MTRTVSLSEEIDESEPESSDLFDGVKSIYLFFTYRNRLKSICSGTADVLVTKGEETCIDYFRERLFGYRCKPNFVNVTMMNLVL